MTATLDTPAADVRDWTRRLALTVILVTSLGGGAFVLVDRPHDDCMTVADMMADYRTNQERTAQRGRTALTAAELLDVADAESATAQRLHEQAGHLVDAPLRAQALTFAAAVAGSAETQREQAQTPVELDPFDAVLPELDPSRRAADDMFLVSAHALLAACPSVPRPQGLS